MSFTTDPNSACLKKIEPSGQQKAKDQPLDVNLESDETIVIRVGIDQLAHAIASADWAHEFDTDKDEYFRNFAITNSEKFAREVITAMLREREDGSTRLSDFFDEMAREAMDDGAEGCDFDQRVAFGKKAKGEKF